MLTVLSDRSQIIPTLINQSRRVLYAEVNTSVHLSTTGAEDFALQGTSRLQPQRPAVNENNAITKNYASLAQRRTFGS